MEIYKRLSICSQDGNALLTVMLAMVLLMGIAGALVEHSASTESAAINESLARIQVHWAMVGQLNYMAAKANTLSSASDSATIASMEGFLTTLPSIDDNSELFVETLSSPPIRHRWYFPEMGKTETLSNYFFNVETNNRGRYNGASWYGSSNFASVSGLDVRNQTPTTNEPDPSNTNGRLYFLLSLSNPSLNGVIPSSVMLQTVHNRFPSLKVDLCVGEYGKTTATLISTSGCNPGTLTSAPVNVNLEKLTYVYRLPINN